MLSPLVLNQDVNFKFKNKDVGPPSLAKEAAPMWVSPRHHCAPLVTNLLLSDIVLWGGGGSKTLRCQTNIEKPFALIYLWPFSQPYALRYSSYSYRYCTLFLTALFDLKCSRTN